MMMIDSGLPFWATLYLYIHLYIHRSVPYKTQL